MDLEEVADLIVQGMNREAYDRLRDITGMITWEARARMIEARNKPSSAPLPTEAELDAAHDRGIAMFASSRVEMQLPLELSA